MTKYEENSIAIIGMGNLFPSAKTPQQFWQILIDNKNVCKPLGKDRLGFDYRSLIGKKGDHDRIYQNRGGYIDDEITSDDLDIEPGLARQLDKKQRWSLYAAKEALKNSGYLNNKDVLSRCGLVVGDLSFPTERSNDYFVPQYHNEIFNFIDDSPKDITKLLNNKKPNDSLFNTNSIINSSSTFLSHQLALGANAYTIDAACASSLYAIELACKALRANKADMMLAGAISAADPLFVLLGFSIFQALPESRISAPFDKYSQGLLPAEGAGFFVLKRLGDAIRDHDDIEAVILSCGLSNDGGGQHILQPSVDGQLTAYQRAYDKIAIDAKDVDYIECHATGTKIGDITELNSISKYFSHNDKLKLGAVKSNFGHLLTAAGMPAMMKVIHSINNNVLPATININESIISKNHSLNQNNIVRENIELKRKADGVVSGVNAFGFGGANAHMVLTSFNEKLVDKKCVSRNKHKKLNKNKLAIVGLGAHFSHADNIAKFCHLILGENHAFHSLPNNRWKGLEKEELFKEHYKQIPKGAYIDQFEIDCLKYKISPQENEQFIAQQILLLKVVDEALEDASIEKGSNVAVIVAMGTELALHQICGRAYLDFQFNQTLDASLLAAAKDAIHPQSSVNHYSSAIGNTMASRVSSAWDFSGPAFTVSSEENSCFQALEVAKLLFDDKKLEAVVVAAVDLSASYENVLLRSQNNTIEKIPGIMSWDQQSTGWSVGEGAGAIVLKNIDIQNANSKKSYCYLSAVDFCKSNSADMSQIILQQANDHKESYSFEVNGSGYQAYDKIEQQALLEYLNLSESGHEKIAINCVKSKVGHCFFAAGMASLLSSILSLHQRALSPISSWQGMSSKLGKKLEESNKLYVSKESRAWHLAEGKHRRASLCWSMSADDCASIVKLEEADDHLRRKSRAHFLQQQTEKLIFIQADTQLKLISNINDLIENREHLSFPELINCYGKLNKSTNYTLSIIAEDITTLNKECAHAKQGIEQAFARLKQGEFSIWQSPRGSYFCPKVFAKEDKVCFVYPGAFNSYSFMAKTLFQMFPQLHDSTKSFTSNIQGLLNENLFYEKHFQALTDDKHDNLHKNAIAMFEHGICHAVAYTEIIRDIFKIKPHASVGYSMGEVSMLYASGVWQKTDKMSALLKSTEVFKSRLAGPMNTLREVLDESERNLPTDELWHCRLVMAGESEIKQYIFDYRHVYLLFVNSENECVVAGLKSECLRLLDRLDVQSLELNIGDIIHSPLVKAEFDSLRKLHDQAIYSNVDMDFYTAVGYRKLDLAHDDIAKNIATMYCQSLNFPKLINKAYGDGCRIFVELGSGDSCTNLINKILYNKYFITTSINKKGVCDHLQLLKTLAVLASANVDFDNSILFELNRKQKENNKSLTITVKLGGESRRKIFQNRLKENNNVHYNNGVLNNQNVIAFLLAQQKIFNRTHRMLLDSQERILSKLSGSLLTQFAPNQCSPRSSIAKNQDTHFSNDESIDSSILADKSQDDVIWQLDDLIEFAEGSIAKVFGGDYSEIDTYSRRVRLPSQEYLLVSRVTEIKAKCHSFKPSSIVTEYDIPINVWYSSRGHIPWAVAVESGQCDLLLVSFIGIDFQCKGDRVYRLLDCELTFEDDIAIEGDSLRYEIRINSFSQNADQCLFSFEYDCTVGDKKMLSMRKGIAGFFNDKELDQGQGIRSRFVAKNNHNNLESNHPAIKPLSNKKCFDINEIYSLCEGDLSTCFGDHYDNNHCPDLVFSSKKMLMIERITNISHKGGHYGYGYIIGLKQLKANDWYFPCHFKDDQVLAGSLVADGCSQLLRFFAWWLGLHLGCDHAVFQPIIALSQKVRCRGQITPQDAKLIYTMHIKKLESGHDAHLIADVEISLNNKIVVDFENIGLSLKEITNSRLENKILNMQRKRKESKIEVASSTGKVISYKEDKLSSDQWSINNKQSIVLHHHDYQDGVYPLRAHPFKPFNTKGNLNDVPDTLPFTQYHFIEFASGKIENCFGNDFKKIYKKRIPPRTPNADLQLCTRVVEIKGKRNDFKSTASCVAEFDVPADAWFFKEHSHQALILYSILMEISLQPNGFISAWLGTTLALAKQTLFFRNLDGKAKLFHHLDLRDKTIRNKSTLLNTVFSSSTIIQSFTFELSVDGLVFYKGEAMFGYFVKESLMKQLGLDQGEMIAPWHRLNSENTNACNRIQLNEKHDLYYQDEYKRNYFLAKDHFRLFENLNLARKGGQYNNGYVYAEKKIDHDDWFFPCHFHQDPVMPGSLGVEALFKALEAFCLHYDLAKHFLNPTFCHELDECIWKYRGQITAINKVMSLDVHIKQIDYLEAERKIRIYAEGNVYKDQLRIYHVAKFSLAIVDLT